MSRSENFWQASLAELKQGYCETPQHFLCLLCGKKIEKGIIYPEDGTNYEAARYCRLHIEREHQSVFDYLIGLDEKWTGLTPHQQALLRLFHQGKSDQEIQQIMGIGSASTIRNHRFMLKERERQAKLLLTIMELLREKDDYAPALFNPHPAKRLVDECYDVTAAEREKVLQKYFPDGPTGKLARFNIQQKHKLIVLGEIAKRFEIARIYTEKEVNEILKMVYDDATSIRRYLIDYGFMARNSDASEYWLKE